MLLSALQKLTILLPLTILVLGASLPRTVDATHEGVCRWYHTTVASCERGIEQECISHTLPDKCAEPYLQHLAEVGWPIDDGSDESDPGSIPPPTSGGVSGGDVGSESLNNPLVFGTLRGILEAFVQVIIILAIPFVVFFVIYSGFLYVTARGNPQTLQKASKALMYAIIGAVIILGASAIAAIVENTVNQFTAHANTLLVDNRTV